MKNWLRTVLLVFFSAVFLISAYLLLDYYLASRKQKAAFDELAQLITLSTCEYTRVNGRFVVVAKRISEQPRKNA